MERERVLVLFVENLDPWKIKVTCDGKRYTISTTLLQCIHSIRVNRIGCWIGGGYALIYLMTN